MVHFSTTIKQFKEKGEKTGWTYIDVSQAIAEKLQPGKKTSFRVKGTLDSFSIRGIALIPMGGGDFIMALNADLRKAIGKNKGAKLLVAIEADEKFEIQPSPEFITCLADEPPALKYFQSLALSHQRYFIKWIDSAKTEPTKIKRIAQAVSALSMKQGYGEMLRALKKDRKDLYG